MCDYFFGSSVKAQRPLEDPSQLTLKAVESVLQVGVPRERKRERARAHERKREKETERKRKRAPKVVGQVL